MHGKAGGVHFGGVGFDREVLGSVGVEDLGEVSRSAADVEDDTLVQRLAGQTSVEITDQFDGVPGQRPVEDVGCSLFVAEVAQQPDRSLQGGSLCEQPRDRRSAPDTCAHEQED